MDFFEAAKIPLKTWEFLKLLGQGRSCLLDLHKVKAVFSNRLARTPYPLRVCTSWQTYLNCILAEKEKFVQREGLKDGSPQPAGWAKIVHELTSDG